MSTGAVSAAESGAPAAVVAAAAAAAADPCSQAMTTADMAECGAAQAKLWDQRLNRAYQKLKKRVESTQRKPLVAAQRLWVRFRDANCGFYAEGSGTIARVAAAQCMQSMTQQRACELETVGSPEAPAPADCQ